MTNTLSSARMVVEADVTDWTAGQRDQFMNSITAIEAQPTQAAPVFADVETTGWTVDLYTEAMAGLLSKYGVQAHAIKSAIQGGTGFISREEVYKIGSYPESRSLKGFTRPVNRIMERLTEAGKLPEDAEDLLVPDYDPAVKGYQRARGFRVPMEIVMMIRHKSHKEGR